MRSKREPRNMPARTAFFDGSERVAEYLRNSYPDARAKRIARALNISPGQAERYLAAESCPAWLLFALAKTDGWDFVRYVFEPLCGSSKEDVADRLLARVEAHAHANREIIREAVREAVAVVHGDVGVGGREPAEHRDDVVVGAGELADQAQSLEAKPPAESKSQRRTAGRRRA